MKNLLLACVLGLVCMGAKAQSDLGLMAGPQATWSKYSIDGQKQPNEAKYGFQLGGTFKIPFDNRLYFTPAAFYSLKGYKVNYTLPAYPPDTNAIDNNTTIHTFELAFLLQYDLGKTAQHFFIKAGPSIDIQLAGKEKYHTKNGSYIEQDMLFDFAAYGHFGANILLQLGYETSSGFFVFGQYTHGIGSINNADQGPRIRHRALGISIGKYLFRLGPGRNK